MEGPSNYFICIGKFGFCNCNAYCLIYTALAGLCQFQGIKNSFKVSILVSKASIWSRIILISGLIRWIKVLTIKYCCFVLQSWINNMWLGFNDRLKPGSQPHKKPKLSTDSSYHLYQSSLGIYFSQYPTFSQSLSIFYP